MSLQAIAISRLRDDFKSGDEITSRVISKKWGLGKHDAIWVLKDFEKRGLIKLNYGKSSEVI